LPRVVIIGSSAGGIIPIHLAPHRPDVLAAAAVNDAGPVMGEAGRRRVQNLPETVVEPAPAQPPIVTPRERRRTLTRSAPRDTRMT
jgi:hypothetical protein